MFVYLQLYSPIWRLASGAVESLRRTTIFLGKTTANWGGVDLGSMDAKLLRKLEELTLYVIQQQKQIDELQKKLDEKLK